MSQSQSGQTSCAEIFFCPHANWRCIYVVAELQNILSVLLVASARVRDQFVCTAVQSLVVGELENCSQCSVVLSCVCCFTSVSSALSC